MNIDIESIGLLSLILQDSPKDRQLILCILARSNTVPTRITFNPNTDYPTFYGYSNSRIPFYLMGKGVISNVPREGDAKRLLSSHYLSYAETIINRAKNWDIHQKGMSISKFTTLDNKTAYKDAEVFLVFRDKALGYIKDYASSHKEEISSFLGAELSGEVFKTVTNSGVYYPQTIPDRTEEFIRLAREASVREHQRNLDDRNRREDAKTARILVSTKDKYLHAVDLISEYAEMAKNSQTTQYADNGTTFSVPYYFFNFEDHIKVRDLLEAFLYKLRNEGCFEFFNRGPSTPLGSDMIFHKVNLEKLRECRNKLFKEQKNNERSPQGSTLATATSLKDNEVSDIGKDSVSGIPYCVTESGVGYLKFGKFGKKKKIGRENSRHFRLLQNLLSLLNVAKTVDAVFEAIRLPKDKNDTKLLELNTSGTRKVELIEYAIKELQKGNKLEGKIKFEFNSTKTTIKAKTLD